MKKISALIFLLSACATHENKNKEPFTVAAKVNEDEWATYEGHWSTQGAVVRMELSLRNGGVGVDSDYKLIESYESDIRASGTVSNETYSTYSGFPNHEFGIRLHNLGEYANGSFLRFKKSPDVNEPDEMFFLTRGSDELLPCDQNFKPLTEDRRYTLHKRSKLFTVEGYITYNQDSTDFFERNTRERWKVTNLGEFDEVTQKYKELAKEKFEGIYLKALAYSVADTTSPIGQRALVIKRALAMGNDPD